MPGSSSNAKMSHTTFAGKNGRIAFVYGLPKDGGGDVYTMNSDGTHVRRLTRYGPSFKVAAVYVGWSPDARRIVFWRLSTKSGVGRLWIMDSDGRKKKRIFDDPGFSDIFPSFSPDGKQIVFARQELSGDFVIAIYRVSVDGTGLTPITRFNVENNDLRPEYSPDGKQIEFETGGRGGFQRLIALCNADGSDIRFITPPERGAWAADWSPDGRRFLLATSFHDSGFGRNEEIWSLNLDDERMARLTTNNVEGQRSYYAAPHDEYPDWAPDGTAFVFVRWNGRFTSSGLFIMTNHGGNWTAKPLHPVGLPEVSDGLDTSWAPKPGSSGYAASRSTPRRIETNGEVPKWGTAPNL